MDDIPKEKEGFDIAQLINWILTVVFIIVLVFAINQRLFEEQKCKQFCTERMGEVGLQCKYSDGTVENKLVKLNWTELLDEGEKNG